MEIKGKVPLNPSNNIKYSYIIFNFILVNFLFLSSFKLKLQLFPKIMMVNIRYKIKKYSMIIIIIFPSIEMKYKSHKIYLN